MRDVERVIRARGDREPCLVGGVEDGRRDLADAAAETGLHLAVDDHRRLEEALRRAALARRPVERECGAGRDQLPVDQVRDELHVVDAVRVAAVDGLVAADRPGDPHRLRLRRRARRRLGRDDELCDTVVGAFGSGEDSRRRARDVERDPRLRRHDANASVAGDREARVARRAVDRALERREVARRRACRANASAAAAACGSDEHLREPPPRDPVSRLADDDRDGRGDHLRGESLRRGERGDGHRRAPGCARAARPARARTTRAPRRSAAARGRPVEHLAGRTGGDRDVQPATHEPRLAVPAPPRPRRSDRARSRCRRRRPGSAARRPAGRTRSRAAGTRGRGRSLRPAARRAATAACQSTTHAELARREAEMLRARRRRRRGRRRARRHGAREASGAWLGVSPPTSTPAMRVPEASRSGDPAKRARARRDEQPEQRR